ncbi:MAG: hypothetical protein ABIN67_24865 [Ferruginibacter sp.]
MNNQKVAYIHCNPVTAEFVAEPWHWIYGGAADYIPVRKACWR